MENNSSLKVGRNLTIIGQVFSIIILGVLLVLLTFLLIATAVGIQISGSESNLYPSDLEFDYLFMIIFVVIIIFGLLIYFIIQLVLGILVCKKVCSDNLRTIRAWSIVNIVLSCLIFFNVVSWLSLAGGIILLVKTVQANNPKVQVDVENPQPNQKPD